MGYVADGSRYSGMRYNRCGESGLKLPAISLGLWHNFGDMDVFENGRMMVRKAFDLGITHFDLANNYGPPPGSAETNFGRILRTDLKAYCDELVISSKAGYLMWPGPYGEWGSRKNLVASADQSLERLGVDYVDIFYHHRPDPETPMEETLGALDYIVRSGRALYAGISNYTAEQTGKPAHITDEKIEKVRQLNILAHERGQSLAQMSLAWVLRHPAVTSALIGASCPEQIEDAAGALNNTAFTVDELRKIDAILRD